MLRLPMELATECCACEQSKKAVAIKSLVRREFEKGRQETDPDQIENLKAKYVTLLNPASDGSGVC